MTDTSNMKVEDRLADKLKSSEFGAWFGEEDLHELVAKALDKAFFQPVKNPKYDYYSRGKEPEMLPGAIIQMAAEHLKARFEQIIIEQMRERMKEFEPDILLMIERTLAEGLDKIVVRALSGAIASAFINQDMNLTARINTALMGMQQGGQR